MRLKKSPVILLVLYLVICLCLPFVVLSIAGVAFNASDEANTSDLVVIWTSLGATLVSAVFAVIAWRFQVESEAREVNMIIREGIADVTTGEVAEARNIVGPTVMGTNKDRWSEFNVRDISHAMYMEFWALQRALVSLEITKRRPGSELARKLWHDQLCLMLEDVYLVSHAFRELGYDAPTSSYYPMYEEFYHHKIESTRMTAHRVELSAGDDLPVEKMGADAFSFQGEFERVCSTISALMNREGLLKDR